MNKRFQVFVSSTFTDLQEERSEVIQALLELDCFPAGMELFPAASEEQWNWIKRVIDESDYYIVIIGGRYGTVSEATAQSYTEMEYRYALEVGKPVIGFLHADPTQIASGKTEELSENKKKLEDFRALVKDRLCKFYSSPADLAAKASISLLQLIRRHPATGWVRGNVIPEERLGLLERMDAMGRFGLSRVMSRAELEVSDIAFANSITLLKEDTSSREFLIYGKTLTFISRQIHALRDGLSHGIRFRLSVVDPMIHPWDVPYSRLMKMRSASSIEAIRRLVATPDPSWTGTVELRKTPHPVENSFSSFVYKNERISVVDFNLGEDLSMQCSQVFTNALSKQSFAHHLYSTHEERYGSGGFVLSYPPRIRHAYVYGIKNGKVAMVRKHGSSTWELPGGTVERGEIAEETAQREFAEETGFEIVLLKALDTQEPDKLAFVGKVRNRIGEPDSSEVAKVQFFSIDNLPEHDALTFPDTEYGEVLSEIDKHLL